MSYGLYVGKNLTADGIAYLAGYGDEPLSAAEIEYFVGLYEFF